MSSLYNYYKKYFSSDINHFIAVLVLCIYPIFFIIGNAVLNTGIIIIDIIFIIEILNKKKFSFFKNYIFYSLILFWLILLLNLFFSISPLNSFGRSFGFVRFIFFVMAILYYFNIENNKFKKIIVLSWSLIFLVITFDLIFEIIYGKNILGFNAYTPGRLASFFGGELIVGHFYYAFILIIIIFLKNNVSLFKLDIFKKKLKFTNFFYFFIFLFLIISFMIGERSNFIKVLLMVLLFSFIFERTYLKIKLLLFTFFFILLISIINFNPQFKARYLDHIINPFGSTLKGPIEYIFNSKYGNHYNVALKIFQNNKLFGVGLKNYRNEIKKKEYQNLDASIHPHQTHFEILSELGFIGYLGFLLFFIFHIFKFFKNNKNTVDLHLAGFLFVITSLIPFLPSGSFFTSHSAILFWMNFALMSSSIKKLNL